MREPETVARQRNAAAPDAYEGTEGRNRRVMENQGLVHTVARGFCSRGVELEDLVQFGNVGLVRAAEKFEPERGLRFSTYAVYWIRQAIYKGVANTSRPIRVPLHARKEARAIHIHKGEMEAETGVAPTFPEAVRSMEALGLHHPARSERLLAAAEADRARFGVKPLEDIGEDTPAGESPLAVAIDGEHREQMARAMELLPEGHREYLRMRYGLDGTPPLVIKVAAALLGISWRAAERMEREAIAELRRLVGRG